VLVAGTACAIASPGGRTPVSASGTGPPRVVAWDAADYAYTAPDALPSGWVTIRMTNRGREPHHGQLLRLNEGTTFEGVATALRQEGEAAVRLASLAGGPAVIDPHRTDEVTLDLEPGTYALVCLVPSPDGVSHAAKGMLKRVEVSTSDRSQAAPPQSHGTLTMRDFAFDMPDTVPSGRVTYEVRNAGPQPHELVVVKLADGTTVADVQAWFRASSDPPPFEAVGGINALGSQDTGYMTLDLQPGSYAAVCVVPESASGVLHVHLGMVKSITVPA
jgi:hypothetical protein